MDKIRVIKLQADDLAIFQALRLESLRAEPAAYANSLSDWTSLTEQEWRNRLKLPIFVILKEGDPIGIMGLMPQSGEKRSHRASLIMVYLRQGERGTGLADILLKAVLDFAQEHGLRQIELNVNHTNKTAIQFYKRHGFLPIGRLPAALIDEGCEVDEIIMVRR